MDPLMEFLELYNIKIMLRAIIASLNGKVEDHTASGLQNV